MKNSLATLYFDIWRYNWFAIGIEMLFVSGDIRNQDSWFLSLGQNKGQWNVRATLGVLPTIVSTQVVFLKSLAWLSKGLLKAFFKELLQSPDSVYKSWRVKPEIGPNKNVEESTIQNALVLPMPAYSHFLSWHHILCLHRYITQRLVSLPQENVFCNICILVYFSILAWDLMF